MTPEIPDAMRRRVVVASTLGNALEWFDFTVFGLFAGLIARLFFPAGDPANALLLTFATFGVAFAARPLGGLVFGLYADRHGRKKALVAMIALMALGTGLIGVLPTYAAAGIVAPALLLLARIIQGFSAGGEFGGASALLIEFAPPGRRGFFGAFQMVSQALAFAAGAAISLLLAASMSASALENWGWRIPFLLGVAVGPVGLFLRRRCDESPDFAQGAARVTARESLGELFGAHRAQILVSFCVIAAGAALTYVNFVFTPVFAVARFGVSAAQAQAGLFVVSLACAALLPAFGALSDRFGRRAVVGAGLVGFVVSYTSALAHFVAAPGVGALWLLQASGLFFAVYAAPVPALMTEIFPARVRATGASLAFNIAGALFGGLAPAIVQALIERTGYAGAPAAYVLFAVAIGFAGLAIPRALRPALAA